MQIRFRSATALYVFGEELEKARIIDGMVVIMTGVDIQRMLGHGATGDVQYIGQAFAHGRVQRLVHIGNALAAGEVGRAQAHHAHTGRYTGSGVFTFGLKENQVAAVDILFAPGDS